MNPPPSPATVEQSGCYVYPVARTTFGQAEIAAAEAVLASGRYTMGPRVAEFEEAFAEWVGSPHAVMVNSGSSANLIMVASRSPGYCRPARKR